MPTIPVHCTDRTRRRFLQAGGALALAPYAGLHAQTPVDPSRIALVIGNDAYLQARLANAANDAKAMAALLRQAGFGVDLRLDVNHAGLNEATRAFAEHARRSEVKLVFFYYAGHGAQLEWRNFLLPVDARVQAAADLPAQCLDLAVLLGDLSKAKDRTFVIVLDACRDNPFGARYLPAQKGLSQYDAPPGSLLAFSTSPGRVAADGDGANGLYTGNLVRELAIREARLEDALKRVRLAVRIASHGMQIPWESTSLESDVLLFPTQRKPTEEELERQLERELAAWNVVKASNDIDVWVAYLRNFPSGRFSEIAQYRLTRLLAQAETRIAASQPLLAAAPLPPATAMAATAPSAPPAPPVAAQPPAGPASTAAPPPPPAMAFPDPQPPASADPSPSARRKRQPQLILQKGVQGPVLMRPSGNPGSAGTYPINRQFTVGDEVVYDVTELLLGGSPRVVRQRVTRVDDDADLVELNRGRRIIDSMGNILRNNDQVFEPRFQLSPAEFQLGKKWKTRYWTTAPDVNYETYIDFRVASRETTTVPAGQFDAFKLEGVGYHVTSGTRLTIRQWVVPNFNFHLRYEIERQPRKGVWRTLESFVLVSCVQHRWSVA